MASRPLHILVTRPSPAGEELCVLIREQGHEATHLPAMAFAPPTDLDEFHQSVKKIGDQDWLIFISPQAVKASIPAIRRAWPNFPPQLKLAAVGEATANALKEAGYLVAAFPAEWNSEGLLNLSEFQDVAGKNITIVRGEGGRDLLQTTLSVRGANVSNMIAYRRVLPSLDMNTYADIFKQRKIDVIVCTSYTGVQNFKTLLGATYLSYIKGIPLIVVSERIKKLAYDLDFQPIWVARNASSQAILEMLAERRNEICQIKQKS